MPLALLKPDLPPTLMQAESLPSLPVVAIEVLRLTQDPETTIQDLAETISRDPALASKLLKLANSSLFNPGPEVATLERATIVLGMKTVKLLSLSFSLVGSMPQGGVHDGFDYGRFWQRSLTAAVAGRSLACLAGVRSQDEVFLVGLLGQIGRLVLTTCLADDYTPLAERHNGWPSTTEEESSLGFSSSDVGMVLLQEWQLPVSIHGSVGYMYRPNELPAECPVDFSQMVWLAHMAQLATDIFCGEDGAASLANLHEVASREFGLKSTQVDQCLASMEPGIGETAELLQLELPEGDSHTSILDAARNKIVDVSLGAAMDLRQAEERTQQLEEQHDRLKSEANTDSLTSLPNRKAFDEHLAIHVDKRCTKSVARALGLVMIDVDHFKLFNDIHGHPAGDQILREIGRTMKNATRSSDMPARYGGEEFAIIIPKTTPFGIRILAERVRKAIEDLEVEFEGKILTVTASFGAACVTRVTAESDGRALLKLADHYLYKAKENGRNRVEIYPKVQFPGR
ncbi:MAG: two-component system cell cycle response regulator [Planctomycetota bacterium]|jgi:two-component system cell cycle response regulator